MRISLNNVWLTNDGVADLHLWTDAHDVQFNGTQVVQDAQFLRALTAQPLARGNAVNRLRFTVTRQFSTVASTAAYVATAFSTLPTSGLATLVCGALGETPVTCTFTAVLEAMPEVTFRGTRADATFLLRGGAITSTAGTVTNVVDGATFNTTYTYPPGGTIDGGSPVDVLASGALALDGGAFN